MANQWLRLYAEFATDPKVQMLSEANQRRFIMLLCIRCSNDDVTLHDEEVAFQLRISNEEWAQTKAIFVSKNLITESNVPAAWDARQFVSDSSTARVAKHREKKKQACNVSVTTPDTDTDTDTEEKTKRNSGELPMESCAQSKEEPAPKPQKKKFDPESLPLPANVSASDWAKWCRHRREIHKPMTELSATQQLAALGAMPDPCGAILHSIANGWQGIFQPKNYGGKPAKPSVHDIPLDPAAFNNPNTPAPPAEEFSFEGLR